MTDPNQRWSARLPLTLGLLAVVLLFGGVGAWSVNTKIAGAVVATGVVEVESERQVIQHPDGGVVGEIFARDGDLVEAGEILLQLDGTFLRSELSIVERQLAEIFARSARLIAERDGAEAPDFSNPPDFGDGPAAALSAQIDGQSKLFEARRDALDKERSQLTEQQSQIHRQIEGTTAQLEALQRQHDLVSNELTNVQSLFDRGLAQASRLLDLQREDVRLLGEIGSQTARVAEARTRISALEIEILKLVDRRREEAISRLRDLDYSQIELEERRISLLERISRLDVRAPVSGVVFNSRVVAVQSVVRAADPMMFLIPGNQPLQVSARIDPIDIDQVHAGQDVALMFTTFSRRTTPEIPGKVLRVSADAATDEVTGATFYQAIIAPDRDVLAAHPEIALLPGMPVEAFMKAAERTPLSYLTQPLTVYFQRAFREE